MTGGNNYFKKYLKPILLFITLFCFLTMQSNQDPDIISRTEYNERIKNWDPTEKNPRVSLIMIIYLMNLLKMQILIIMNYNLCLDLNRVIIICYNLL